MRTIGVIPARMASTRFPNKPLAEIHGMAMLGHVYHRSRMARSLDAVYIATCDEAIRKYSDSIGAPCVMTAASHERATDRSAEAADIIERETGQTIDAVMMVQGDEPMLQPEVLDHCIEALRGDPGAAVVNLMEAIESDEDFYNINVVKTVTGLDGCALFFSRAPIPSSRPGVLSVPRYKQLGLIAFRRPYLSRFRSLAPTPLEIIESCDMMRAVEHGDKVRMVLTEHRSVGVDTPGDLERVEHLMRGDSLMWRYVDG
jgi:3-deoxy-manno-octulosonate cytidylyltransferase (CMP-KDO synthetase)